MKIEQKRALVLFAKDPVPGKVKTRLSPWLGDADILKIYRRFLEVGLETLASVKDADCFVGIHPSMESGFFQEESRLPSGFRTFLQEGSDLGEKMRKAFQDRLREGYERVVIIGADSPSLPVAYIQQALDSRAPLVLGPAVDGGYYLIAMGPELVDVFGGIQWGGETVLRDTASRIAALGADLELLPVWYDVDHPSDLKFLLTHLELMKGIGAKQRSLLELLKQMGINQRTSEVEHENH
ncbi:MAG: glycosyltransferase [Candidatus Nitrohelix vancouverensis]|uniref:Glycosyltransferase n=1 Tax=Candidatus Nitrohelix vancouverensis TaxID=2705534 RepID=A0A7T0G3J0_9BACT|nr:MAG: glycosyltransferase [Candidatus Nitrohelix vancouverensis]